MTNSDGRAGKVKATTDYICSARRKTCRCEAREWINLDEYDRACVGDACDENIRPPVLRQGRFLCGGFDFLDLLAVSDLAKAQSFLHAKLVHGKDSREWHCFFLRSLRVC